MMSDNESGIKRATEQDEQLEALKKQKLDEPEEKKPVQADDIVAGKKLWFLFISAL